MGPKIVSVGGGIIAIVALAFSLLGCTSNVDKADELYDAGKYSEALEIYASEEANEAIEEKMSECRFWLFVDYLRDKRSVVQKTEHQGDQVTTTITATEDGTIKIEYVPTEDAGKKTEVTMTIPHDESIATLTEKLSSSGVYGYNYTFEGEIDLGTFVFNEKVKLEPVDAASGVTSGLSSLSNAFVQAFDSDSVRPTFMVKQLGECMRNSGTDCTYRDIGFERL